MEPTTLCFLVWLAAIGVTWISARAILSTLKSELSENTKATWIAFIVCTPIIGAVTYWLFSGGPEFTKNTPEEREAALKRRLNQDNKGA